MSYVILVPILCAMIASIIKFKYNKNNFFFIEGVALSCAFICVIAIYISSYSNFTLWWLVGSFLFSIIGDFFMKRLHSNKELKLGILFFLMAHLGFLIYSLRLNGMMWWIFMIVLIPFVALFIGFYRTAPRLQEDRSLALVAFVYIIMSGATLSANMYHAGHSGAWVFLVAITCLIVSDLLIAIRELYHKMWTNYLIMPLYYLCHILIGWSVVLVYFNH